MPILEMGDEPKFEVTRDTNKVNDALDDVSQFANHIEGNDWYVDYYRLTSLKLDSRELPDPDKPNTEAQYEHIEKMRLKVVTPLPSEVSEKDLSGEANVVANFTPSIGDMILIDMINGREALLYVDKVATNTYLNDNIYNIGYKFFIYTDTYPDYKKSVVDSVIKDLVYISDNTRNADDTIITKESNLLASKAESILNNIKEQYFRVANTDVDEYLLLPNTVNSTVMPELSSFMLRMSGMNNSDIKELVVDESDYCLFNVIDNGNIDELPLVDRYMNTISMGINNMYLVNVEAYSVDSYITPFKTKSSSSIDLGDYIKSTTLPDLNIINTEGTYLFTNDFYEAKTDNLSVLEKEVLYYINQKTLTESGMVKLLNEYYKWNDLEKYLYLPILYFLLYKSIRNNSVNGVKV